MFKLSDKGSLTSPDFWPPSSKLHTADAALFGVRLLRRQGGFSSWFIEKLNLKRYKIIEFLGK
jgi:hypothetical protein